VGMNPDLVLGSISSETRAVFVTHAQGFSAVDDRLYRELSDRGIMLIEDVCESHGAKYRSQKLGSIGEISNFSFYYAHHMSTIEGGMICTNNREIHELARLFRSHGMVRESTDDVLKKRYADQYPDLNPDFIFAVPAFNMRGTEIGGVLGRSQLTRLDQSILRRNENHQQFLKEIDHKRFFTEFNLEGSSNYAFNLFLREPDSDFRDRLIQHMRQHGIEHRRGSAGGGNQLRQPYLKNHIPENHHKLFPIAEHIHFFGFYLGNYPELSIDEVSELCEIINSCK